MSCMTTSAPPERSITWMGSILNLARRIRETRKIPTALTFVLERMASRWREEMSFPQKAVTRNADSGSCDHGNHGRTEGF